MLTDIAISLLGLFVISHLTKHRLFLKFLNTTHPGCKECGKRTDIWEKHYCAPLEPNPSTLYFLFRNLIATLFTDNTSYSGLNGIDLYGIIYGIESVKCRKCCQKTEDFMLEWR